MRHLFWFKEDLRIYDNPGLYQAVAQASDGIVALYIIDASLWKNHGIAASKVSFILRGLKVLSQDLARLHIPLLIETVNTTAEIPEVIHRVILSVQAKAFFYNHQYEVNESRRNQAVADYLNQRQIKCLAYHDQVIFAPGEIVNKQQQYYKVFTAYKKAWLKWLDKTSLELLPAPKKQSITAIEPGFIPDSLDGFSDTLDPDLWPAGEPVAQQRLADFIERKLFDYDKTRDFPALDGTSRLSPYLSVGMLSPRQCFFAALQANQGELFSGNRGALTWMQELIWREYYKHILVAVPRVSMNRAYKPEFENIAWQTCEAHLRDWQQGKTGYPIIDAAMRQLNQTGWMHNRLRMISAMFLSKNLLLDWRLGESYFMQHLIDGDLAANNGGWQWSASTGTDAVPYFRIFNPITQSERFDPQAVFIRKYCPEIAHLNDREIHAPYARAKHKLNPSDYPRPIVELQGSRERAILAFKTAKLAYAKTNS